METRAAAGTGTGTGSRETVAPFGRPSLRLPWDSASGRAIGSLAGVDSPAGGWMDPARGSATGRAGSTTGRAACSRPWIWSRAVSAGQPLSSYAASAAGSAFVALAAGVWVSRWGGSPAALSVTGQGYPGHVAMEGAQLVKYL